MQKLPSLPQLAARKGVSKMAVDNVVVLVIGVATLVVAFVGLVIKLIELGRK